MKRTSKHRSVQNQPSRVHNPKLPFIEHVYELRKRLFYVTLSVGLWATGAYFIQHQIVAVLLRPAHEQQFIYTTVGGGIDFLIRVCLYTGIACSIPVIVYQVLQYIRPLIKRDAVRFMAWGSIASGILALLGMAFGYFFGLPAALHFLLHQFSNGQIEAMLSINSYMSFVTTYMLGSALIFQLPLLLVLINRIKPLQPKKLLAMERWVILIAFVLGGILSPSPRVQDQVMLAGPIIVTYQIGVLIVWLTNRRAAPSHISRLREQDEMARLERLERARQAGHIAGTLPLAGSPFPTLRPEPIPIPLDNEVVAPTITASAHKAANQQPSAASPVRPVVRRNYLDLSPRRAYDPRTLAPLETNQATPEA